MTTATTSTGIVFSNKDRIKSLQLAKEYAGKKGRVATLPDIINAKLADPNGFTWQNGFSTATTEYYGESKGGTPIIIVAHGTGPLLENPKKPKREKFEEISTRITKQKFLKLESGKYGPVEVIDRNELLAGGLRFQEPLIYRGAKDDPLLNARLGPKAEEFLKLHRRISQETAEHSNMDHTDIGFIVNNHDYKMRTQFEKQMSLEGKYFGHFITISSPIMTSYLQGEVMRKNSRSNLVTTIREDRSSNWYRFVGMRGNELSTIDPGIDAVIDEIEANYQRLMVRNDTEDPKFYALIQEGLTVFTQTPKQGAVMDIGQPQYKVTEIEPLGVARFRTIEKSSKFFKYDINEVKAIAPKGANAYVMGRVERVNEEGRFWHAATVRFYKITADTTKRMLTEEELRDNPGLVLNLNR